MALREEYPYSENPETIFTAITGGGEQSGVGPVLNEVDQPFEPFGPSDHTELVSDIVQQLHKPASFDLFTGIVAGVSVRTGLIDESNLDRFVWAMDRVRKDLFDNDLANPISSEHIERTADVQDEMLSTRRASAEVMLDVVLKQRGTPKEKEATFLNRLFLLTVADIRESA